MISPRVTRGAALALLLAGHAAAAADGAPLVATRIKGEVILHAASAQTAVSDRGTIEPGQTVETRAASGVQLDFLGAIDLTLGPGAALMYHSADAQQLRVKLGAGDFEARVATDADLRFNVGALRGRAVGARIAGRVRADAATICVLQGSVSVQTPKGETRLDQPGQCLERNGNEELVRGPGAQGTHGLPEETVEPMGPTVGATALPPPPPAALSSPPPSVPSPPQIPPSVAAAVVANPTPSPPAAAPPPPKVEDSKVAAAMERAPHIAATVAMQPKPVAAAGTTPPLSQAAPPSPAKPAELSASGLERAPRVRSTIVMRPKAVVAEPVPPSAPATATASASPLPVVPQAAVPPPVEAPVTTPVSGAAKPVFVTPFAETPSTTRVAVSAQRVLETAAVSPTPAPSARIETAAPPAAESKSGAPPVVSPPVIATATVPAVASPRSKSAGLDVPALATGWTVVIAALNSEGGAVEESKRLRQKGLPADIFVFAKDGQKMYRIGLGRFDSYEAAAVYATRVRKELPDVQPWIAAFGAAPG